MNILILILQPEHLNSVYVASQGDIQITQKFWFFEAQHYGLKKYIFNHNPKKLKQLLYSPNRKLSFSNNSINKILQIL